MKNPPSGGFPFAVSLLGQRMAFLRYPIEVVPPDGSIGIVECAGWRAAAKVRSGAWVNSRYYVANAPRQRLKSSWAVTFIHIVGSSRD